MNVKEEIKKIDAAITELIYDKTAIKKAYNYYHKKRDYDQFLHIEENYGIGVPTGVGFNPLVRPHIDRLIGEYLGLEQDLKISCKDTETLSNIMRDKQLAINKACSDYLKRYLQNNIIASILDKKESTVDPNIEKELDKIKNNIEESFISEYEIAAQNILDYIKQSRNIDLKNKMHEILIDLLVSGTCYFRVKPTSSKDNIRLEALNPIDTFVEKDPNSPYLADSRRAVIRKYMSSEDIISEYREFLSAEDINTIRENSGYSVNDSGVYYIRATQGSTASVWNSNHTGVLGGLEVHPTWPGDDYTNNHNGNLWVVYEVEWIEVDKDGVQHRHEGIRIGDEIYIAKGESEYVNRTKDDPKRCRLSINGLFLLSKNGEPNSIVLNTMDLQDKYDLLCFYRDNLIASSGTVGDWIDLAFVPQALGVEFPERLQKWLAYKKQGIGIIDSSQEGAQMMNTIFNGFDDTIKSQSIQAIVLAMQTIEQQVSKVTGVLPEAMAQYEQRDAVSNVQLGVKTTMLLTKQYFQAMDIVYKEANYDMLNLAKIVWKKGITGTIVLGNNYSKIFTALPQHYTVTDWDIHIEDSTKSYQNVQSLISIAGELLKSGAADLADITNIMTSTSITELKRYIDRSIKRKKEENDMIGQLQQQVQQYEQNIKDMENQNQQLQQQVQQLQAEVEKNNRVKMQLEAERLELDKQKARNDKDFNDKQIDIKEKQVQAQVAQIFDTNPYNDKIKQVV